MTGKRFSPKKPSDPVSEPIPLPGDVEGDLKDSDKKHGRTVRLIDTISLDWEPKEKDVQRALGRPYS
jgi:hypothetical protein